MCAHGNRDLVVIGGRNVMIDSCLVDIIRALNFSGVRTSMCCCGHGEADGYVLLGDEERYRLLIVCPEGKESLDRFRTEFQRKTEEFDNRLRLMRGNGGT